MKPSEEEEFKEKSNEEKMEKEMKNNDEEIEIYRIAQVWLFQAARRWNGCKSQCLLWPIIEFEAGIVHSVSVNVWIFLSRVGTNKSYPNPEISLISLDSFKFRKVGRNIKSKKRSNNARKQEDRKFQE